MVNKAEKNDVDISKLFAWGDKFTIKGRGDISADIYIRLLGDADLNRARVFALRKSAELRRKLKETDSEDRLAKLPDFNLIDKDTLVENILPFYLRDITLKAYEEVEIPEPKPLTSDSTLEEQEEFQLEVDNYPARVDKAVKEYITKETEKERKKLNKRTKQELVDEYEQVIINRYCEREMVTKMKEMCAFLGSYLDEDYKTRAFNSFDAFENLPAEIKEQFIDAYSSLEIGTDELKN